MVLHGVSDVTFLISSYQAILIHGLSGGGDDNLLICLDQYKKSQSQVHTVKTYFHQYIPVALMRIVWRSSSKFW